jgi:hypothetical protein
MRRFKEYVTILLVSATFIVLTADIDPLIVERLGWPSWLLLGLIVFLFRPLSVYLSTLGSDMDWRERVLLGWIAPRGIVAAAVAGLFAGDLAARGYAGADLLLPLVFSLIVITVVLHGLTVGPVARRLDLASPPRDGVMLVGASPWSTALAAELDRVGTPVLLIDSRWNALRSARMHGLPTHYGEILSERTDEVLELAHITRLLAVTPNEAYNTLVCLHFGPELGYHNVRELGWSTVADDDDKRPDSTRRGTPLFDDRMQYDDLERRLQSGWRFETTPITTEFTASDATGGNDSDSCPVAAFDKQGGLYFHPWGDRVDTDKIASLLRFRSPAEAD